jgi:hypothetical protein
MFLVTRSDSPALVARCKKKQPNTPWNACRISIVERCSAKMSELMSGDAEHPDWHLNHGEPVCRTPQNFLKLTSLRLLLMSVRSI